MKELKEAEAWLYGAKALSESNLPEEKYTVVVAMCVHSIIKANDALTSRFLFRTAIRHEKASELFLKLVEQGKIDKKYDSLRREILIPAIRLKSFVDYRGATTTRDSAQTWLDNAKKFIDVVKECLR